MMDPGEFLNDLPKEIKDMLAGGPKLIAPPALTIKAILDAGAGEHQNRLWTLACKHSIEAWINDVKFAIAKHAPELKGQFDNWVAQSGAKGMEN
jgi:hypothetical protein